VCGVWGGGGGGGPAGELLHNLKLLCEKKRSSLKLKLKLKRHRLCATGGRTWCNQLPPGACFAASWRPTHAGGARRPRPRGVAGTGRRPRRWNAASCVHTGGAARRAASQPVGVSTKLVGSGRGGPPLLPTEGGAMPCLGGATRARHRRHPSAPGSWVQRALARAPPHPATPVSKRPEASRTAGRGGGAAVAARAAAGTCRLAACAAGCATATEGLTPLAGGRFAIVGSAAAPSPALSSFAHRIAWDRGHGPSS